MNNKIKYFNIAKEVSRLSNFHKVHVGAVLVYKKQILAVGYNQYKSHPLQAVYNRYRDLNNTNCINHSLHAETQVLSILHNIKMNININKVAIYIYREHKLGGLALARPCLSCMKLIKDMGIKNIWYTVENGYAYERI